MNLFSDELCSKFTGYLELMVVRTDYIGRLESKMPLYFGIFEHISQLLFTTHSKSAMNKTKPKQTASNIVYELNFHTNS